MLGPGSDKKSGRVSGRFGRGKEERGTVGGTEGGSSLLDLRHSESDRSAVNIFRSDQTIDLTPVTINQTLIVRKNGEGSLATLCSEYMLIVGPSADTVLSPDEEL